MTAKTKLRIRVWHAFFWESIEILVALSSTLTGFAMLLHHDEFAPPTINSLPTPIIVWWAGAVALGGSINLHGILFGNLYTRRAGLMLLAGVCIALATSLVFTGDTNRLVGVVAYSLSALLFILRFVALGVIDRALDVVLSVEEAQRDVE